MKTPEEFADDRENDPEPMPLVVAIQARDAEHNAALAASNHALRVAVEHARDVQARLDEAMGLLRHEIDSRLNHLGCSCPACAFLASVESPGVAGRKCGREGCGTHLPHRCHHEDYPVPDGNAGAGDAKMMCMDCGERGIDMRVHHCPPGKCHAIDCNDPRHVADHDWIDCDERHGCKRPDGCHREFRCNLPRGQHPTAPAPERNPCAACKGKGYFRANGYPCTRADSMVHAACGMCGDGERVTT